MHLGARDKRNTKLNSELRAEFGKHFIHLRVNSPVCICSYGRVDHIDREPRSQLKTRAVNKPRNDAKIPVLLGTDVVIKPEWHVPIPLRVDFVELFYHFLED